MANTELDWETWAELAPQGRAESIYYILAIPMAWNGPPPGAHRYSGLHFKIGRSKNVLSRVGNLRSGTTDELIIHAMEPGSARLEAQLHGEFGDDRRQGEWFAASPRLAQHVWGVWRKNSILPPEHLQKLMAFFDRKEALAKLRASGMTFDMVNPSVNESWFGRVLIDGTNPNLMGDDDEDDDD